MGSYRDSTTTANETGEVIIERDSAETGKPGRVFVTGPHFNANIYSSTRDEDEASTFDYYMAKAMLAQGKWHHLNPEIKDA